jgi:hypothetical protein
MHLCQIEALAPVYPACIRISALREPRAPLQAFGWADTVLSSTARRSWQANAQTDKTQKRG